MVSELERMGDLSVHVAKIARLRVPEHRRARGGAAHRQPDGRGRRGHGHAGCTQIITGRDVEAAIELGRDDEEMDQLRRTSFTELLSDDWTHGVEAAVDVALLGRYYERIADHAVSVANRVVFVVTGQYPRALRRLSRRDRSRRRTSPASRAASRRLVAATSLSRRAARPATRGGSAALVGDGGGGLGGGLGVEVRAARRRSGAGRRRAR